MCQISSIKQWTELFVSKPITQNIVQQFLNVLNEHTNYQTRNKSTNHPKVETKLHRNKQWLKKFATER